MVVFILILNVFRVLNLKLKIANGGGGGLEHVLFLPCPTPQSHLHGCVQTQH
jgi:hypothetical protein